MNDTEYGQIAPLLVKVMAADQHDSQVGYQLLSQLQQRPYLLPCVRKIFADGAFAGIMIRLGLRHLSRG